MSLVLSKISKLWFGRSAVSVCSGRDAFVRKSVRLFSSSTSPSPFLLLPSDVVEESPADGKVVNFNLYDPRKGETVKIPDQTLPLELYPAERVGASRGWLALLNKRDFTIYLTNVFNPSVSPSSHRVISLPPLDSLPCFLGFTRNRDGSVRSVMPRGSLDIESPESAATYMVDHVCLSSSPDEDDCVVGVWFWERFLGFCRPGDSTWTYDEDPLGSRLSEVMYSKRDRVFYHIGDEPERVRVHHLNNPKFLPRRYVHKCARFQNIPEAVDSQMLMLETLHLWEYIVETPTGELLVASRYTQSLNKGQEVLRTDSGGQDPAYKTLWFRVYRLDIKHGTRTYTENIGDMSLFLGMNEGFCLPASQYPGLKPNSIYFADDQYFIDTWDGHDNGVYDIAEKTITGICNSDGGKVVPASFWLAPSA